jgi:predicted DNA-binding transcriptional regulator AlpA
MALSTITPAFLDERPTDLLKRPQVLAYLKRNGFEISYRTLSSLVQRGQFPEPTRINRKLVYWPRALVDQFLEKIRAGRPVAGRR